MTQDDDMEMGRAFFAAIRRGSAEQFEELLRRYPEALLQGYHVAPDPVLSDVVGQGRLDLLEVMLEQGANVNINERDGFISPLTTAIHSASPSLEVIRVLLEQGANPNYDRSLISAINANAHSLEIAKLLVEHGVDIHKCFTWPDGDVQNALSWALVHGKTDVADYLRSLGAVMPEVDPESFKPEDVDDEIIAYFRKEFGEPQPLALTEIVPDGPPIAIHVIPPAKKRLGLFTKQKPCVTLFTTGMSRHAMTVPEGGELFRFAELFIQLPADWPWDDTALNSPEHAWPFHWLRQIAKYPHLNQTWLGGPLTIIANDEPPQALAPGVKFTCLMALAEKELTSQDGRFIRFYRVLPLYTEERDLERDQGAGALMQAFDKSGSSFVVDVNRVNAATATA